MAVSRVAFIPARGGSKRIPRKNVMNFQGKPMLCWTLDAAAESGLFDRIIVSSEDPEIIQIARTWGAEIHERPEDLAGDLVDVDEVLVSFLQEELAKGALPDVTVVLYATSPLRTAEDIKATADLLGDGCDTALAVSKFPLPPHQAMRILPDSCVEPVWPELIELNARDIGDVVVDNGSTYAVRSQAFLENRTFFGPGTRIHIMPFIRSVDLDEPEDLVLLTAAWSSQRQ